MSRSFPQLITSKAKVDDLNVAKTITMENGTSVTLKASGRVALESTTDDVRIAVAEGRNVAIAGTVDMDGHQILGLPQPSENNSAASKLYVDTQFHAMAQGLSIKSPARLASTANDMTILDASNYVSGVLSGTGTGVLSIDGTVVAVGDRVLVKDLTNLGNTGIYVVTNGGDANSPWSLTRADDAKDAVGLNCSYVMALKGETQKLSSWVMTTPTPVVVGTTPLTWVLFSKPRHVQAGNGMSEEFPNFNVLPEDATLTVSATGVKVNRTHDYAWTGNHSFVASDFSVMASKTASLLLRGHSNEGQTLYLKSENEGKGSANIVLLAKDTIVEQCSEKQLFNSTEFKDALVKEFQIFKRLTTVNDLAIANIPANKFPETGATLTRFRSVLFGLITDFGSIAFECSLLVVTRSKVFSFSKPIMSFLYEDSDKCPYSPELAPTVTYKGGEVIISLALGAGQLPLASRTHVTLDLSVA